MQKHSRPTIFANLNCNVATPQLSSNQVVGRLQHDMHVWAWHNYGSSTPSHHYIYSATHEFNLSKFGSTQHCRGLKTRLKMLFNRIQELNTSKIKWRSEATSIQSENLGIQRWSPEHRPQTKYGKACTNATIPSSTIVLTAECL
ncbi:unnamed protein product [Cuscuta epithymum]|uniref:Uncharacterized protein n=1 Tax=Cuscuta epithymum TaxID=186058 RepID=A0AAV0D7I4_9ASTE|nr:unnamed protein product [Cuscuta epithymum]